jgi:hypothetical protein
MEGPELEEQIQIYAEEVMPLLSKECGGGVENPASTVQLVPSVAASRVGEFATATPGSSDGARGR